jgi:hypothetical protein
VDARATPGPAERQPQVHRRCTKGPRRCKPGISGSSNSEPTLPLWHLIPGQEMKKGLQNRVSVEEGVPPRPARGAPLVAGGTVAAGRVRAGRAFRRQPGVKNSAFTGTAPLGHSGNGARPDTGPDGPPGRPARAGRPDGS